MLKTPPPPLHFLDRHPALQVHELPLGLAVTQARAQQPLN
jgi:hypothetical protein